MFFFCRKRESSQEENKTWKAYTKGIWTLNLSRDDPAGIKLVHYLQVIILPFMTAAQKKHVQIHV